MPGAYSPQSSLVDAPQLHDGRPGLPLSPVDILEYVYVQGLFNHELLEASVLLLKLLEAHDALLVGMSFSIHDERQTRLAPVTLIADGPNFGEHAKASKPDTAKAKERPC